MQRATAVRDKRERRSVKSVAMYVQCKSLLCVFLVLFMSLATTITNIWPASLVRKILATVCCISTIHISMIQMEWISMLFAWHGIDFIFIILELPQRDNTRAFFSLVTIIHNNFDLFVFGFIKCLDLRGKRG